MGLINSQLDFRLSDVKATLMATDLGTSSPRTIDMAACAEGGSPGYLITFTFEVDTTSLQADQFPFPTTERDKICATTSFPRPAMGAGKWPLVVEAEDAVTGLRRQRTVFVDYDPFFAITAFSVVKDTRQSEYFNLVLCIQGGTPDYLAKIYEFGREHYRGDRRIAVGKTPDQEQACNSGETTIPGAEDALAIVVEVTDAAGRSLSAVAEVEGGTSSLKVGAKCGRRLEVYSGRLREPDLSLPRIALDWFVRDDPNASLPICAVGALGGTSSYDFAVYAGGQSLAVRKQENGSIFVYLPPLPPGRHQLRVEASSSEGFSGTLRRTLEWYWETPERIKVSIAADDGTEVAAGDEVPLDAEFTVDEFASPRPRVGDPVLLLGEVFRILPAVFRVEWKFDDGSTYAETTTNPRGKSSVSHRFQETGRQAVDVKVTDEVYGRTGSVRLWVNIGKGATEVGEPGVFGVITAITPDRLPIRPADFMDIVITFTGRPEPPITVHIELDAEACDPRKGEECITGGWSPSGFPGFEPKGNRIIINNWAWCIEGLRGWKGYYKYWLEDKTENTTPEFNKTVTCGP